MNKKYWLPIFIFGMICLLPSSTYATKLTLQPVKVSTIISPADKDNTRILVYFDLPDKLNNDEIHIACAKLVFNAEVSGAAMGDIEVYPVTTSWKDLGSPDWNSTWEKEGGDFSYENIGIHVTAKSAKGKQSLRSDVTFMVKAWLDGIIDNHGLIIVPSEADMNISDAEYSIDTKGITLVITYEY